jgi:hypothetical protein
MNLKNMREGDNSKINISSNFILSICLHLSTLHFLSFTLHYSTIWLNPSTFPVVIFYLPSLNQTQYDSHIPKLISKVIILTERNQITSTKPNIRVTWFNIKFTYTGS